MKYHSLLPRERTERLNKRLTDGMMAALKTIHSATSPDSMAPSDLNRQRMGQEVLGRLISPPIGFSWEPFTHHQLPMAWVRPQRSHQRRQVILYCHGGGYTRGNLGYARVLAAKMSAATGRETLAFQYRLAPEHPYPAALEDAVTAWDYLMHLGYGARDVIVAGDSAGGNLALELTLRLKERGRFLPGRLVLFSPWTDMTASGRSYQEREEIDPVLTLNYIYATRDAYARGQDLSDPCLSPLFADLTGFPPTLIQAGTNELLLSDSVRLRNRMLKASVPCNLEVWDKMWHVFQTFPMKKANEAMEHVAAFLMGGM